MWIFWFPTGLLIESVDDYFYFVRYIKDVIIQYIYVFFCLQNIYFLHYLLNSFSTQCCKSSWSFSFHSKYFLEYVFNVFSHFDFLCFIAHLYIILWEVIYILIYFIYSMNFLMPWIFQSDHEFFQVFSHEPFNQVMSIIFWFCLVTPRSELGGGRASIM